MNKLLAIAVILLTWVCPIKAGSVTLEIEPGPEADLGFTIESKPGAELDPGEWKQVASTRELFLKVDNLTPGMWSFRARAVHLPSELSSLPSNVVVTTIVPEAPKLRIVEVQMSRDMNTWETVATVPVPEADRAFYRIAFSEPP